MAAISVSDGLPADRREQAHPADAHGQLVVLGLEAEGAGHAAAAGVELLDLGARDPLAAARPSTRCRRAPSGGSGRGRGSGAAPRSLSFSAPSSIASTSSSSTSFVREATPRSPSSCDVLLAQRQQARRLDAGDRRRRPAGARSAPRPWRARRRAGPWRSTSARSSRRSPAARRSPRRRAARSRRGRRRAR